MIKRRKFELSGQKESDASCGPDSLYTMHLADVTMKEANSGVADAQIGIIDSTSVKADANDSTPSQMSQDRPCPPDRDRQQEIKQSKLVNPVSHTLAVATVVLSSHKGIEVGGGNVGSTCSEADAAGSTEMASPAAESAAAMVMPDRKSKESNEPPVSGGEDQCSTVKTTNEALATDSVGPNCHEPVEKQQQQNKDFVAAVTKIGQEESDASCGLDPKSRSLWQLLNMPALEESHGQTQPEITAPNASLDFAEDCGNFGKLQAQLSQLQDEVKQIKLQQKQQRNRLDAFATRASSEARLSRKLQDDMQNECREKRRLKASILKATTQLKLKLKR